MSRFSPGLKLVCFREYGPMKFSFQSLTVVIGSSSVALTERAICNLTSSLRSIFFFSSASSRLIARASCSCNSSSPVVCGRACSISDDGSLWIGGVPLEAVHRKTEREHLVFYTTQIISHYQNGFIT